VKPPVEIGQLTIEGPADEAFHFSVNRVYSFVLHRPEVERLVTELRQRLEIEPNVDDRRYGRGGNDC